MYPHRVTFHGAWALGYDGAKSFGIETGNSDDEVITPLRKLSCART
ncbi:MAG: hypothetical protein IJM81_05465 [Prevotella sp.]|nr:hypothetical protein [Prevotella sp.]